jgi:proliferating cell nuclear antigen
MEIHIDNPQKAECFGTLFQHIKLLTEQINIIFDKTKMYVQAIDSSHVSILEITIPKEWFGKYALTSESNVKLGIRVGIFYKILSTRDSTQTVTLKYDIDNKDTLDILLNNEASLFNKQFSMPLIELDAEMMDIPEIEYSVEMSLPSPNFAAIVTQLQYFGDNLEFHCTENNVVLSATSPEQGTMSVEIKIDDLNAFAIEEGYDMKLSFSLKYIHVICLYNKIAKEMEIKLHKDYPVRIEYRLMDGANIRYFLAPRCNDD